MKHLLPALFFILFVIPSAVQASAPDTVGKVLWIFDGDTIRVEEIGKVRLLGIDAPERGSSERDRFYLKQGIDRPRLRQVADEALNYLIRHVKGSRVELRYDRERFDRHGRTLAYVYLPDGRLLNRLLVEKGLAAVYRKFEFSLKESFLTAEEQARKNRIGLWAD